MNFDSASCKESNNIYFSQIEVTFKKFYACSQMRNREIARKISQTTSWKSFHINRKI